MGTDNLHHKRRVGQLKRERKKIREYKNSILIICEGEKTEPQYFKRFPTTNVKVATIGIGKSNIALIKDAIVIWKKKAAEGEYFERLWCVFDRDDFPLQNYNQSFENIVNEEEQLNKKYRKKIGRRVGINIAYSNQAFELWYLLHFDYIDTALERFQYQNMLSHRMQREYKKNDPDMYSLLIKFQDVAINNAKKLEASIKIPLKHNHNPSSTVYQLVEELNLYLKK